KNFAIIILGVMSLAGCTAQRPAAANNGTLKFDFDTSKAPIGYIAVSPENSYSAVTGYGFDLGTSPRAVDRGVDALKGDFVTNNTPFYFSIKVPEGNYKITLTLGDI